MLTDGKLYIKKDDLILYTDKFKRYDFLMFWRNPYLFTGLMFFSLVFLAQAEGGEKDNVKGQVDSYVRIMPSRSVKGASGGIKVFETGSEFSRTVKFFEKLPVKFSIGSKFIGIDKTVVTTLPAHLTGVNFDAEATLPFFNIDKMYLGIGVTPSFYGDQLDFAAADFRIPSRYFAVYQPNEKWTWVGGVAVLPRYAHRVLPIFGVTFKPNDRLNFNIVSDGPEVSYGLNDRMTLFLKADVSADEFVVDRDNSKNVVLRYTQTNIGGGVKLKVNQFIRCSLSLGDTLNNTLGYRDSNGKVSIKNGLYGEFRVEAGF